VLLESRSLGSASAGGNFGTIPAMRTTHRPVISIVALSCGLASTLPLAADQIIPGEAFAPPPERKVDVIVSAGGAHEFRRSLDDGGSVSVSRAAIDTTFRLQLAEPLSLALTVGYRYDLYDFGGAPFPNVASTLDPWDDIHTLSFGGMLSYRINDVWTVSGGGFGQFSAERDASWSDAFTGGGLVSLTYRMGDRGIIGGGIGVTSSIEDDAKFFPVVVVDMPITDSLRVTTLRVPTPIVRSGVEIVYEPAKSCEIALGIKSDRRRFRLNDRGSVPDGVGEEKDLPLWLRGSWKPSPTVRVDLIAGVILWREFGIADQNGLRIDTDNGKPAFFAGAGLRFEF